MEEHATIDIDDNVTALFEEMRSGLRPDIFAEWVRRVQAAARMMCNDIEGKVITIEPQPDGQIKLDFRDVSVVPCVVRAIKSLLDLMPVTTRLAFEKIIELLEQKIKERQETNSQSSSSQ
ncbi:MAG: hypothetical protein ABI361_12170 [Nitrososphaera sp.]|jgi:predicted RNA-binding protein with RPS1 domain